MFVIGMDPQLIAAALEDAHTKVREHLPRYERMVPLGWRFMDKFIQLPFTIPPARRATLEPYVEWLSSTTMMKEASTKKKGAQDEISPVIEEPVEVPPDTPAAIGGAPVLKDAGGNADPQVEAMFKESRDVGAIIREAARNMSGNPREIKRLANVARLYLGLRDAARSRDSSWRSPSLSQYARWITLTLRWPDMMRWLQWGADEGTWGPADASMELLERRLQLLEGSAQTANTAKAWREALVATLNVPDNKPSDWACDANLFEFFQAEVRRPSNERLSTAVARGFW
jgi:hypothetical protein